MLLVEPWLTEEAFSAGFLSMQTYDGEDIKLCRSNISRREGPMSIFDFHWLAARRGAPDVEYLAERHSLCMYSTETLLAAFTAAGFETRHEPDGLMPQRGLIVGRRC